MKKKLLSGILIAALLTSNFITMKTFAAGNEKSPKNDEQIQINKFVGNENFNLAGYISGRLTKPSKEDAEEIAKKYLNNNAKDSEFIVKKKIKNDKKETIIKTQQTYKGIRVKGFNQSVIIDNEGVINAVSGVSIPDIGENIKNDYIITESKAIEIAKNSFGRQTISSDEVKIEKIITLTDKQPKYAYSVLINSVTPYVVSYEIVIDASTGAVLEKNNMLISESVTVTGKSSLDGATRSMTGYKGSPVPGVTLTPEYEYSLVDTSKLPPENVPANDFQIVTYEMTVVEDVSSDNLDLKRKLASDNDGNFIENSSQYPAVDAHYYQGLFYDFLKNEFGRYSYDDNGGDMIGNVHAYFLTRSGTLSPNNAAFDLNSNQIFYGDGDGTWFAPFAADPETIGHEFTHAIINNEASLYYFAQSGAVHEGLADFFGEVFEESVDNTPCDWKKLSKIYTPDTPDDAYLDYKNPDAYEFEDDMGGYHQFPDSMENYYKGSSDMFGVHANAAILTKAFSLMCDGGTYRNVTVPAIGMDSLSEILYKTITERLTSYTDFRQLAEAALDSAASLYGSESIQCKSVQSGFQSVGIVNSALNWNKQSETDFAIWPDTCSTCQIGGTIYVLGGFDSNVVFRKELWAYDINSTTWTRKADLPVPCYDALMTVSNNKLYVLFGFSDTEPEYFSNEVYEYSPSTNIWASVSKLPSTDIITEASYSAGTVLTQNITRKSNFIAVNTGTIGTGGSIKLKLQGSNNNISYTDIKTYDPVTASNSTIKYSIPYGNNYSYYRLVATVQTATCNFGVTSPYFRVNASICEYAGKIYILGGRGMPGYLINTMDIYDTVNKTWTKDAQGLTYPRNNPTSIVLTINGAPKLYVLFGSENPNNKVYNKQIEVYDINNNQWSQASTSPSDYNVVNPAAVVYNGKLHFAGGYSYSDVGPFISLPSAGNGVTAVYDYTANQWYTTQLPGIASMKGSLGVYNNTMYYVGATGVSVDDRPVEVHAYLPLSLNTFENNGALVINWSRYDTSTNSILKIDGSTIYSGTESSYRYTDYKNDSKKHTIQVTQTHPIYGTISSKSEYTTYSIIGDVDGDNFITSADIATLNGHIFNGTTLNATSKLAADINCDNTVNILDLAILSNYVNNGQSYSTIGQTKLIVYGDLTNDGIVDEADVKRIKDIILGSTPTLRELIAADVDGNGSVNSIDLGHIKRYITLLNTVLPVINI